MRIFGGLVVLLFSAVMFLGLEPFSDAEKGHVPRDARRGPSGIFFWHGGYMGGK